MFSLLRPPKKCFKCETIKSHHFEEAGKKKISLAPFSKLGVVLASSCVLIEERRSPCPF